MSKTVTLLTVCALILGCSSKPIVMPERTFNVAYRKHAPDPVYSRLRWGHLPEVIPNGVEARTQNAPLLMPVASLELKDVTLEEASKALAKLGNYSSYCSSYIADRRISLTRVGTLDELGEAIAGLAHIKVVIDHNNRSVSFLGGSSQRLLEGTVDDEHRSHY